MGSEMCIRDSAEGKPNDLIEKYDSSEDEKGNLENVFLYLTGRELFD